MNATEYRFRITHSIHMGICIGIASAGIATAILSTIPGFLDMVSAALGSK